MKSYAIFKYDAPGRVVSSCRRLVAIFGFFLVAAGSLFAGKPDLVHVEFPDERIAVEGLGWWGEESKLYRLPLRMKETMPPKVWDLAGNLAGVLLRFRTDSPTITFITGTSETEVRGAARTGSCGVDLYSDRHYVTSDILSRDGQMTEKWTVGTDRSMREIMIYLPLFRDAPVKEIVLEEGAKLEAPQPHANSKPIVFYGSSITQGGQASNPGMAFPSLLGRWLDRETINLGFSGNGFGEPELAQALAELSPSCFVLDYWANGSPEVYSASLPEFIAIIRAKHPDIPILLTGPYYNPSELDPKSKAGRFQLEKRVIAREFVAKCREAGDKNIHHVEGFDMISPETADGLVDGRHANSFGMFLCARGLEPHLRRVLELPDGPKR